VEYAILDRDGNKVERGDTVTDFRGEPWQLRYMSREPIPGYCPAKVVVVPADTVLADGAYTADVRAREFYATVFDLRVVPTDRVA
jgi:hypothetical protein